MCLQERVEGRTCLPVRSSGDNALTVGEDLESDACQLASGTLRVLFMPHPKRQL